MKGYNRTIWLYYLYKTTTSYGFIVPFSVIYLQHQGYGLDVIGLTQAAFLIAVVVSEVPAGYVADRFGRRRTLAAGNLTVVLVFGGFPFVDSTAGWVAVHAVWGVGWSFHSAIGDAWLYSYLDQEGVAETFARTSGRGASAELTMSTLTALIAAGLYTVNPDLPFFANAALSATGVPLVVSLPAVRGESQARVSVRKVFETFRLQLSRPEIRWLVLYAALFNALFSATRWLEQPSLEAVGFPLLGFGILYASFKLVTAGAMLTTGWIQEMLGPRLFFLLLAPVCAIAYGMIAVLPLAVIPVIYLRRVLDRVSAPIRNQYINDRVGDIGRATILSGVSMVLHLASGISSALFGQLAESTGPLTFLPAAGIIISTLAFALWLATNPIRQFGKSAADSTETAAQSG